MRVVLVIAIFTAICGCATTPYKSTAIDGGQRATQNIAAHDVPASRVEPVFATDDAAAEPDSWTARPISNRYSARILPNWEQQDGKSAQLNPAAPASAGGNVYDLVYRVEKPDPGAEATPTNESSEPARTSPFMLPRLINQKDPPLRQ